MISYHFELPLRVFVKESIRNWSVTDSSPILRYLKSSTPFLASWEARLYKASVRTLQHEQEANMKSCWGFTDSSVWKSLFWNLVQPWTFLNLATRLRTSRLCSASG